MCVHSPKNVGIMYVCKQLVKWVRICSIHFCIIERQQVRKCFVVHIGYLELCQCCASPLPRLSLSILPTQNGSYVLLNCHRFDRYEKYSCIWEGQSSCNPTSLKWWNTWVAFWTTDSTENLQLLWGHVRVRRLDLEYFVRIRSTWIDYVNLTILQRYCRNELELWYWSLNQHWLLGFQ